MKKSVALTIVSSLVFLLASCGDFFSPDWQTPVKEFFKEYTESAAIMQPEYDAEFPNNRDGIMCIPSTDDHTITFLLRNPQNYTLIPHYEFNNSSLAGTPGTDYTFEQDPDDKAIVRLVFTKEYLRRIDDGDDKDISGIVSFTEPRSARVFDHYELNAHANTTPPEILSPCFQLTSPSDGEYVVCFYFPKLFLTESGYTNPLHRDAYQFIVNGRTYYIKSWTTDSPVRIYETYTETETGFDVSDPSGMFTTTAPVGLTPLEADGFVFDPSAAPDGYVAMYYLTGQVPIPDDVRYSFTIRDREGLGVTVATSNKAKQLNPPTIQVSSNQSYIADENTGRYTVRIGHDGLCTDGSSCGSVTVHYTATNQNGRKVSGSASGSASIYLPGGTYTISATVTKDYFIASDASSVSAVKVVVPAIYYVSGEGRDSGDGLEDEPTGSKADPFRTVQKAIDVFTVAVADSGNTDITGDSSCEIRLLTDITPPADLADNFFRTNSNSFISIPKTVSGTNLTGTFIIKGYNGKRTINAMRSETSSEYGRVIFNDGVDLQLENLTITGGYTCITTYPEAAPIGSDGAGIASKGNLTMTDCSVLNNTALNPNEGGGGIWCKDNTMLTMTRCTLQGNTAGLPETYEDYYEWCGGAVYTGSSSTARLTDCIISNNTGMSALYVSGALYMTGGKVTGNIGNDNMSAGVYMNSGILDGVEISGNHFAPEVEDNSMNGGGLCIRNNASSVAVDPSEPGVGVIIRNCTIKNNQALIGAGICYAENDASVLSCLIENCTITQNSSYGTYSIPHDIGEYAAGIYIHDYHDKLMLKGVNKITGNTLADGTPSDVRIQYGKKLIVSGSLGNSRIGVYMLFDASSTPALNPPTPGHPLDFTIDYGVANSAVSPANIFISQNGYGIAYNETTGEAGFAVSSGSLYTALDFDISMSSSSSFIKAGVAKTLTITTTATRKEHTDPVSTTELWYNSADKKFYLADDHSVKAAGDETVSWSAALYSGTRKVSDLTVTSNASGLTVTVPAQELEDTYTLKLTATYMGLAHESVFTLTPPLPVDVSQVTSAISAGGTVKVEGILTQESFTQIATAVKTTTHNVSLDLSDTEGLVSLDEGVIDHAYNLTELILPEGLTKIEQSSFWCLYNLQKLHIPASCTEIEPSAFYLCSSTYGLDITLGEGSQTFDLIDGCLVTKDHKKLVAWANGTSTAPCVIPAYIEEIGDYAFHGARFTSISFAAGTRLKKIGALAFENCRFSSIVIPNTVEEIETAAFRYCQNLTSATLPAGNYTTVNDGIFAFCNRMSQVSIPEGVTTIKNDAFGSWAGFPSSGVFTSFVLPSTLETIESGAFSGLTHNFTVYYRGTEEQKEAITISDSTISGKTWTCNYED